MAMSGVTATVRSLGGVTCLLVALYAGVAIAPAVADPIAISQLKKGVFLLATPQLSGSLFTRTVILITDYDESGAIGLIVNRPTRLTLVKVFPELDGHTSDQEVLYFGGPVVPRAVFSLVRTPRPHAAERHVVKDVSFAAGRQALVHMLGNAGPEDDVRAYSGYSGWAPGQLENEIARGDWRVIEADTALIFDPDPARLWDELTRRWSGVWI